MARHYRSEAGRICLQPLYDLEKKLGNEQNPRSFLPHSLLKMYPALHGQPLDSYSDAPPDYSADLDESDSDESRRMRGPLNVESGDLTAEKDAYDFDFGDISTNTDAIDLFDSNAYYEDLK